MEMMVESLEINIPIEEMPDRWYNILPDLPEPLPEPRGDLSILGQAMIKECMAQEFSKERWKRGF